MSEVDGQERGTILLVVDQSCPDASQTLKARDGYNAITTLSSKGLSINEIKSVLCPALNLNVYCNHQQGLLTIATPERQKQSNAFLEDCLTSGRFCRPLCITNSVWYTIAKS